VAANHTHYDWPKAPRLDATQAAAFFFFALEVAGGRVLDSSGYPFFPLVMTLGWPGAEFPLLVTQDPTQYFGPLPVPTCYSARLWFPLVSRWCRRMGGAPKPGMEES
jgi:hypothetical protein